MHDSISKIMENPNIHTCAIPIFTRMKLAIDQCFFWCTPLLHKFVNKVQASAVIVCAHLQCTTWA